MDDRATCTVHTRRGAAWGACALAAVAASFALACAAAPWGIIAAAIGGALLGAIAGGASGVACSEACQRLRERDGAAIGTHQAFGALAGKPRRPPGEQR